MLLLNFIISLVALIGNVFSGVSLIFSLSLLLYLVVESLKRPKEILFEYRELSRQAKIDESALIDLEAQLTFLNIEKLKKSQPWRLISSPRLNDKQISPKKKSIVRFWTLVSIIIGSFYFFTSFPVIY